MRIEGKIAKWKEEKGFGFIAAKNGGPDIFLHKNQLLRRSRSPQVGELVTFELVATLGGKTWAENALLPGQSDPRKHAAAADALLTAAAVLFLAAIAGLVVRGQLPLPVLGVYGCLSVLTFVVYRFDKSAAEFNDWRTPEKHLHLLSVLGGWPGALLAQRVLRHKSRKQSFQVLFWTTVTLNLAMLAWLLTPPGRQLLHGLLTGLASSGKLF